MTFSCDLYNFIKVYDFHLGAQLTSVFHVSVLLLVTNFVITFVKVAVEPQTQYFDNVVTKFIVNDRTDALKTDVNSFFFTITN